MKIYKIITYLLVAASASGIYAGIYLATNYWNMQWSGYLNRTSWVGGLLFCMAGLPFGALRGIKKSKQNSVTFAPEIRCIREQAMTYGRALIGIIFVLFFFIFTDIESTTRLKIFMQNIYVSYFLLFLTAGLGLHFSNMYAFLTAISISRRA